MKELRKYTCYFLMYSFALTLFSCEQKNNSTEQEPELVVTLPYNEYGALKGVFSVSSYTKVQFSRGNLEYLASTNTWRFAEEQYQYAGATDISPTSNEWFSVFGWATSGYNGKYPYKNETIYDTYYKERRDIAGTYYDWGVYNAISNGGNRSGIWRTLTASEWYYLINTREDSFEKFGYATIGGMKGIILIPDDVNQYLFSFEFKPYVRFDNPNSSTRHLKVVSEMEVYTMEQWKEMEDAGCVFLPGLGNEFTTLYFYWTSSYVSDQSMAYAFGIKMQSKAREVECLFRKARHTKQQVRLVKTIY